MSISRHGRRIGAIYATVFLGLATATAFSVDAMQPTPPAAERIAPDVSPQAFQAIDAHLGATRALLVQLASGDCPSPTTAEVLLADIATARTRAISWQQRAASGPRVRAAAALAILSDVLRRDAMAAHAACPSLSLAAAEPTS